MRRQVYVVDDDAQVRQSTCFLLGAHYDCRAFADGNAFLSEVDRLPPGSVLLDLLMPGSSGFEVQAELTRRGYGWPVVAMSGHTNSDAMRRALELGAIDVLAKPFPEEALLAALEKGFGRLESGVRTH